MENKESGPLKRRRVKKPTVAAVDENTEQNAPADDVGTVRLLATTSASPSISNDESGDVYSSLDWTLGFAKDDPEVKAILLSHLYRSPHPLQVLRCFL